MSTIYKDITIDQGADFRRPFPMLDENRNPVDLTGASAAMQVSVAYGFPAAVTLTTGNGGLAIDAALGLIIPALPAAATARLTPGPYLYDLKLVFASGATARPYQGTATVSPQVTAVTPTPGGGGRLDFSAAANSGLAAGVL